MSAISVEALTKTFGARKALDGVSLNIVEGEMVALIGASGSGKSTLLRHVAGLVNSDNTACCVKVDGKVMQENGRLSGNAQSLRREIGVIFQQFNLVNRLSLISNVLVGFLARMPGWRGNLGLFTREHKLDAMRALKRVGISDMALQRASTLSGGQQQRAAIARALVQRARVILADEPIASLDPASAKRVMETLFEINAQDNITVVVCLHQVEYARLYCPRTIALADGKVAYDGPSDALTHDFLKTIYGDASEELVLPDAPLRKPAPARQPVEIRQPALAGA
ncbi:phosphonate ABC transporter ATP-binding protein [Tepidamorphus sp. 3E244]|uniref:phosphonate ABC transporter ATP-binding protein n=1 Tax=Tepidamorphus sp. 3E244 TaxID=3385498 RepID=UPI0038FCFE53